jgi:hypothetical protein
MNFHQFPLPEKTKAIKSINGTMSADIFKHKMVHAIQLKWTFLALKWAVFVLKLCSIFPRKQPLQIASKT